MACIPGLTATGTERGGGEGEGRELLSFFPSSRHEYILLEGAEQAHYKHGFASLFQIWSIGYA